MKTAICRTCGSVLEPLIQPPNSPLNEEQWASGRAGDYLCPVCPDNGRGTLPGCYLWEQETVTLEALTEAFVARLEDLVTDPSIGLGDDALEWPERVQRRLPISRCRVTTDALAACCHDLGILRTSLYMKSLLLG